MGLVEGVTTKVAEVRLPEEKKVAVKTEKSDDDEEELIGALSRIILNEEGSSAAESAQDVATKTRDVWMADHQEWNDKSKAR